MLTLQYKTTQLNMALKWCIRRNLFKRSVSSSEPVVIPDKRTQNRSTSNSVRLYSNGIPLNNSSTKHLSWFQAIQVNTTRIFCSQPTDGDASYETDAEDDDVSESLPIVDVRQFYEGNAGDRNIRQIHVSSQRLDTIASKAFGMSKT